MSRRPARRLALPAELNPRLPLSARRHVRSPLRMLSVGAATALSVLVLAVSSIGWAAYRYFNSSITGVAWSPGGERPAERPGEMNILLLGDDSRAGTNGEYGQVDGVRSDTTIVAHFGADGAVTLVSFPRDTLVRVAPGIPKAPRDGKDKLTNILSYGGVEGLTRTLESLTSLKIDHFISIDLAGFKTMTDAVGGVDVCVAPLPGGGTSNLHDNYSQWRGKLGVNHLNGDQALAFVRTRHALPDETYRVARQQQFLSKLLDKATSAGVLTNPVKITQLIGAVGGSLKVDNGLTENGAMIKIAQRLSAVGGGKVTFITIPTFVPTKSDGAINDKGEIPPHGQVLFYDRAGLAALLAPLRPAADDIPASGGGSGDGTTSRPLLPPGQVTIAEVRNKTGRSGLAAQTTGALSALGFAGSMKTTTGPAGQVMTEIRYPAGQEEAAQTLSSMITGSRTIEDPTISRGLVLVLGTSFTGVTDAPDLPTQPLTALRGTAAGSAGGGTTTTRATGSAVPGSATAPGAPASAAPPVAPANTSCTP
ncbi:LCP family protein [Candidatus Protofrankia californiensis]|uniref:LCP family protein n=1 Tax=Candidatus Protofrankia californiensis TaxID=1839754 RepID=UPI001F496819|nr:LCP family protein [Candidatus Protofrankia californiensis]